MKKQKDKNQRRHGKSTRKTSASEVTSTRETWESEVSESTREMSESKVSMKLLIDTKEKRVLFAEAGKECVDFLFFILTMPLATIIRLLNDHAMVGSLPNLYHSLETLNDSYIQPTQKKDTFLKPVLPVSGSSVSFLALDDAPIQKKFYLCAGYHGYVSNEPGVTCPSCLSLMTLAVTYVAPPTVPLAAEGGGGGLVKGVVTYMVMDNLVINPMSTISSLTLLNKFNIKEVGVLEEKIVTLGINEAVKLLKASLQSKNVLTNVFL